MDLRNGMKGGGGRDSKLTTEERSAWAGHYRRPWREGEREGGKGAGAHTLRTKDRYVETGAVEAS